MAEILTLTAPITKPATNEIRIERIVLDVEAKLIYVQWLGDNNEAGSASYPTPAPADHPTQPTGATLLNTLNTANLTTNSLVKRTINRLISDGYVAAGTIVGTPD